MVARLTIATGNMSKALIGAADGAGPAYSIAPSTVPTWRAAQCLQCFNVMVSAQMLSGTSDTLGEDFRACEIRRRARSSAQAQDQGWERLVGGGAGESQHCESKASSEATASGALGDASSAATS